MDRQTFYAKMQGKEVSQHDELQFQIVHEVEELWTKLIVHTLLDVDERIAEQNTNRVLTLMGRVHRLQRLMIEQLDLLETISPKEFQEIRSELEKSGDKESPGFSTLLQMLPHLWASFKKHYLEAQGDTLEQVYHENYSHDGAYMVAEALA